MVLGHQQTQRWLYIYTCFLGYFRPIGDSELPFWPDDGIQNGRLIAPRVFLLVIWATGGVSSSGSMSLEVKQPEESLIQNHLQFFTSAIGQISAAGIEVSTDDEILHQTMGHVTWRSVSVPLCLGLILRYEPLTTYVTMRVAHAPGMPGTFSPPPSPKTTAS